MVELDIRHFAFRFPKNSCHFVQEFSYHWLSPFHSWRYLLGSLQVLQGALGTIDQVCVRATAQNRTAEVQWSLGSREGSTSHGTVHMRRHRKTPRNTTSGTTYTRVAKFDVARSSVENVSIGNQCEYENKYNLYSFSKSCSTHLSNRILRVSVCRKPH